MGWDSKKSMMMRISPLLRNESANESRAAEAPRQGSSEAGLWMNTSRGREAKTRGSVSVDGPLRSEA